MVCVRFRSFVVLKKLSYKNQKWDLPHVQSCEGPFTLQSTPRGRGGFQDTQLKETRYENYFAFTLLPTYKQP